MTKVLHVSFGVLGNDGVSNVIFSIVEPLHNQFDFGCVVFSRRTDREKEFNKYGKIYRVNGYNGKFIEKIFRSFVLSKQIYKICKENNYQIIHCHNLPDAGVILKAAKKAGVKIRIIHSHNTKSNKKQSLFKRIKIKKNSNLIEKYATHKIGCSKKACEDFFKSKDYKVIYNSIDLEKFNIKNRNPESQSGGIKFVHVGRYDYQKNQRFLIKVFKEIKEKISNASLLLIGFGKDEEDIKSDILQYNLANCVEMVQGNSDFVSKKFAESDYMIFPSRYEGFGIVLLEAQASGCYCFVSDAIQDEVDCGLMRKISLSDDAKTWADIIVKFISEKKVFDFKQITEKMKVFDKNVIAQKYAELYNS